VSRLGYVLTESGLEKTVRSRKKIFNVLPLTDKLPEGGCQCTAVGVSSSLKIRLVHQSERDGTRRGAVGALQG
jgi:hypothetical protein